MDKALVLLFPGPNSETGDDLAEFHLHGGPAVVDALLAALADLPGLRPAGPGEFTRRAFDNGKIDLTGVEGLADLVFAETESQRRAAIALAGGALRRRVEEWQQRLLALAARLEAVLDFSDEGEVGETLPAGWRDELAGLAGELAELLSRPPAERLKNGVKVVIAGPPNAGKSSLLNAIAERDAAITSAIPGTTRDVIEAPTALAGTPFLLADTAGLRDGDEDPIEAIGVERAYARVAEADIVVWLGEPAACPDQERALLVQSKADLLGPDERRADVELHVSAVSGEGMPALLDRLVERGRALLPREGETALNARHRDLVTACRASLEEARASDDPLIAAESLRQARHALDRITGRAGVEDMLDSLFGRLCIGK
jgi:tRNA modification GTPase